MKEQQNHQTMHKQVACSWADLSGPARAVRNLITLGGAEKEAGNAFRSLIETPTETRAAIAHLIMNNKSEIRFSPITGIQLATGRSIEITLGGNTLLIREASHEVLSYEALGSFNGKALTEKQTVNAFRLFDRDQRNKAENIILDPNAAISRYLITGVSLGGGERAEVKVGTHTLKLRVTYSEPDGRCVDGSLDGIDLTEKQAASAWKKLSRVDKSIPQTTLG